MIRSGVRRTCLLAAAVAATGCGRVAFDELRGDATVDVAIDAAEVRSALSLSSMANLWGAGHATPPAPGGSGAGVLPPAIVLPAGSGRVLTVIDVLGTIDFAPGPTTADGFFEGTLSIAIGYDGLVDVTCLRQNMLMAVFLDDSEPADPAPPSLTVDATAASFTGIGLRQFFFVGDGLTGTGGGAIQRFAIPDAATRLYFGFGDALGDGLPPGSYDDNTGSLTATVIIERS